MGDGNESEMLSAFALYFISICMVNLKVRYQSKTKVKQKLVKWCLLLISKENRTVKKCCCNTESTVTLIRI